MNKCHCGTNKSYSDCCQPIHQDRKKAVTAQQLMRARYSAHVLKLVDFIVETTHSSTRHTIELQALQDWLSETEWQKLEVLKTAKGKGEDIRGKVEFKAYYKPNNIHHELSSFEKEGGIWYFVKGETPRLLNKIISKIGRNSPCPCQSGKKYKQCCGKK